MKSGPDGGPTVGRTYLELSLTLGTTRTHSRFWNDDSSHSVLVKVNCNQRKAMFRIDN